MNKNWKKEFMDLVKPFMKSSAGEEDTPPPPSTETVTETGETITDEFLEKLKSAIESGEVAIEESAIKTYCKTNGVSDADCDEIWTTISSGVEGEEDTPGDQGGEQTAEIQKGGNKETDPEFLNFVKSVGKAIQSAETHELAIASLIAENSRLEKGQADALSQIAFMKSEMEKFFKQPIGVKTPVVDISDAPAAQGRAEIIQQIFKGVQAKALVFGDLQTYKSTGRLTDAASEFLKSSAKGGN